MKLGLIISELRSWAKSFDERVYGAAEFSVIDSSTEIKMPCAFVLPLGETVTDSDINNTLYQQRVEQSFGVAVYVSTANDEQGVIAYDRIEELKAEVLAAIAGWAPDEMSEWIAYEGSSILDLNRARLCVQLEFTVAYPIEDVQTRHWRDLEGLGPLTGINVDVDLIPNDGVIEAKAKYELGVDG